MNYLKFLLAFGLIAFVKSQNYPLSFEEFVNETISDCTIKEGATESDIDIIFTDAWPETHEGKCLLECVFEEMGIVRNAYCDIFSIDF